MKRILSCILIFVLISSCICINTYGSSGMSIPDDAQIYNGHSYKVIGSGAYWSDAQNYCESVGGHLVTITSAGEQQFINSMLDNYSDADYLIGLRKSLNNYGTWVTGEAVSYTNWGSDQPDNYNGNQYVGVITNGERNGDGYFVEAKRWDDNYDKEYGFICEWDGVNSNPPFTVNVYGCEDNTGLNNYECLEGASVELDGVTKITGSTGNAIFKKSEIENVNESLVTLKVTMEGYKDYEGKVIFNDGGAADIYLEKKSDKIRIKKADFTYYDTAKDLLSEKNITYVPTIETGAQTLDISIDWNEYETGHIDVTGLKSKNTITLNEGTNTISLQDTFIKDENIKLRAYTYDENGNLKEALTILPLKVKEINVSIIPQNTDNVNMSDLYFLDGIGAEISIGDLMKSKKSISIEDGVLKIEFGGSDTLNKTDASLFKGLTGGSNLSFEVIGSISVPLKEILSDNVSNDTEWSGAVKLKLKKSVKTANMSTVMRDSSSKDYIEILNHTFNFDLGAVPCYIEISLSASGELEVKIHGNTTDNYVSGKLSVNGKGAIGGGVGGAYDDNLEVKVGIEGDLEAKIPVEYNGKNKSEVNINPEIKGAINGKASIKVWTLEMEKKIKLGGFTWNKNGASWDDDGVFSSVLSADNEITALSSEGNSGWKLAGRDYLENESGFTDQNISPFAASSDKRSSSVFYENIFENADIDFTYNTSGNTVAVMTVDNTNYEQQNGMTAMYKRKIGSTWSEAAALDDDGTLDSGVMADGNFVIWQSMNKELNADTNVADALSAQEIYAGKWNSSLYKTKRLTNNAIYDFGAKIKKTSAGGAIAAWLSNDSNDYTAATGVTNLNYTECSSSGSWSSPTVIEDIGCVTNLYITEGNEKRIYYKNSNNELYYVALSSGEVKKAGENIERYAANGENGYNILAYFDNENKLHILKNDEEVSVIETKFNGSENPVIGMCSQMCYIFWTENDGIYYTSATGTTLTGFKAKCCFETITEGMVSNLSCGFLNSSYYTVGYMLTDDSGTNVMINQTSPGYDLLMGEAEYTMSTYEDTSGALLGKAVINVPLYNNGDISVETSNYKIRIKEDGSTLSSSITQTTSALAPGESKNIKITLNNVSVNSVHTYEISVTADDDCHLENNTTEITVGNIDGAIKRAYFTGNNADREYLNITGVNKGSLIIGEAVLNVYKDSVESIPVYTKTFSNVMPGEVMNGGFEEIQEEGSVYYAVLTVSGDENTYDNTAITVRDRIDIKGDVNLDGEVNKTDAAYIMKYLCGSENLSSVQLEAADYNDNGEINISDVVLLLKDLSY
ncbi:MAG: lectin-like protein [Clostridia bacterium]|nr:lectin-like protein [Clostridia bacterium]